MSDIIDISNFKKKNFKKDWEDLYFDYIQKLQNTPEYLQTASKLLYLRHLIISMGVDEVLVDTLIEVTIDKTSAESEIFDYSMLDILFRNK